MELTPVPFGRVLGGVYLGLGVFLLADYFCFGFAHQLRRHHYPAHSGPAILLAVGVVAISGIGLVRRKHGLAAGLVAGYILMTIVSGGTCTLMVAHPLPMMPVPAMSGWEEVFGLVAFVIIALVVAPALALCVARTLGKRRVAGASIPPHAGHRGTSAPS